MQEATSVQVQGTTSAACLTYAMLMSLPICGKRADKHDAYAVAQVTINTLPNTCPVYPAISHRYTVQKGSTTLTQCLAAPCFFFNCLT